MKLINFSLRGRRFVEPSVPSVTSLKMIWHFVNSARAPVARQRFACKPREGASRATDVRERDRR
jgi:hypothetical protein